MKHSRALNCWTQVHNIPIASQIKWLWPCRGYREECTCALENKTAQKHQQNRKKQVQISKVKSLKIVRTPTALTSAIQFLLGFRKYHIAIHTEKKKRTIVTYIYLSIFTHRLNFVHSPSAIPSAIKRKNNEWWMDTRRSRLTMAFVANTPQQKKRKKRGIKRPLEQLVPFTITYMSCAMWCQKQCRSAMLAKTKLWKPSDSAANTRRTECAQNATTAAARPPSPKTAHVAGPENKSQSRSPIWIFQCFFGIYLNFQRQKSMFPTFWIQILPNKFH